jgi:hypothetical protein
MRQVPLDFDSNSRTGLIRFARLLSDILSPPAAFAAAGLVTGWLDHRSLSGLMWGALYGFLASLVPVLFVVWAYKRGLVSDMHMSDPRERQVPYLIGLAGAALSWYLVGRFADGPLLQGLIACHIVLLIALALWNLFKLVSAHVASLTAIALYFILVGYTAAGLVLAPVVAMMFYVRHYLRRHTMSELVLGLVTGVLAVAVLLLVGAVPLAG